MLLKSTACLWLPAASLSRLTGVVRDFRGCTKAVAIGSAAYTAHGPELLRSLQLLEGTEVVLDLQLCGREQCVEETMYEACQLGAKGVTVLAVGGQRMVRAAMAGALRSIQVTNRVRPPATIVTLPRIAERTQGLDAASPRDAARLLKESLAVGATMFMAAAADVRTFADYLPPEATLFAMAERLTPDYRKHAAATSLANFGAADILQAGADHVLYDVRLLHEGSADWTADMLAKEIRDALENEEDDEDAEWEDD